MYSSNSSFNGNDLISYPIQPFCSRPFSNESNPTSKQETNSAPPPPPPPPPPPLSFFQFPFPFEDNEIFLEQQQHHDFLLHNQSLAEAVVNMEMEVSINSKIPCKATTTEQITRRRSSKRDRHSKIKTARGLRDRRMRLSLEVAKRFFGLQDMLGFDKASKTVEWLLNQAKVEIKQLAREKNIHHPSCCSSGGGGGAKSASSTSECEGVSSLDEVAVSGNQEQKAVAKRRVKLSRKSALKPVARESREKARERARERTKEKMRTRRLVDESKQCNEATTNHSMNRSFGGSWNPFETVEECAGTQSQSVNPASLDVLAEAEERSSQAKEHLGTVEDIPHEDSLVIMSKWSPTMIFNSLNNSGILQEHQFAEFQSLGKPWEAYNNHNI